MLFVLMRCVVYTYARRTKQEKAATGNTDVRERSIIVYIDAYDLMQRSNAKHRNTNTMSRAEHECLQ